MGWKEMFWVEQVKGIKRRIVFVVRSGWHKLVWFYKIDLK